MNLVKLSGLALLTSVGLGQSLTQQPSRVVIDGAEVPASALRFVTGAPLVSCQWLDKNVSSLNCELFSSTTQISGSTQTTITAYISENAEPLEGRDATGCCAEQRRYVRFENGQLEHGRFGSGYGESPLPMFEIGAVEWFSAGMSVPKGIISPSAAVQFTRRDAFVPLRDVAHYLRMPWQLNGNKLSIGSSAGFKRTLEVVETGGAWQARTASRYLKLKGTMPEEFDASSDHSLLIWPRGEVKRVFYIYGKTLVFLELRNVHWEIAYRAHLKAAPIWLCSPGISGSKPAGFWAALGGISSETGRRPIISTPLVKHASCSLKAPEQVSAFRDTQFFSVMQKNGFDQSKLWLALSIFDPQSGSFSLGQARVIDPKTRQLTSQPAPKIYDFIAERRILGR